MIMATPAISSLVNAGETVDLFVEGDSEEAIDLFKGWSLPRVVVDSIVDLPDKGYDFYLISWLAKKPLAIGQVDSSIILSTSYHGVDGRRFPEYEMYLHFARAISDQCESTVETYCGSSERSFPEITTETLVLYPGCQERFPIKRWDKFPELAGRFKDVAIVGSSADLSATYSRLYPEWIKRRFGRQLGRNRRLTSLLNLFSEKYNHENTFPSHVKNYLGKLSLADTASLISQSGAFVGNDGGLAHIAAGLGVETLVLFGPTDEAKNLVPRDNVHVIKMGLDCQPCQFGGKFPDAYTSHFIGCPLGVKCLKSITVDRVVTELRSVGYNETMSV